MKVELECIECDFNIWEIEVDEVVNDLQGDRQFMAYERCPNCDKAHFIKIKEV